MELSAVLQGRLVDLKLGFVERMPDRIGAIAATLAEGGGGMTDRLERQFHSLAGTAGMYDLHAVSAAALEGEEACAHLDRSQPLENTAYLGFLVDQLRRALSADSPAYAARGAVVPTTDAWTAVSSSGVLVA